MLQDHSLKHFYDQALGLLAEPVSGRGIENPLFSPENTPGLFIYFGPVGALPEFRSRLPEECFVLGIHDEQTICPGVGRTLNARVDEDYAVEKTALLTTVIPHKKVRIVADDDYSERFADQLKAVQKAVRVAIDNSTSEERRGLIRLRAACCNLKKMIQGPQIIPRSPSEDLPVVLCGAGPSLASEIEVLQELKHSVVIAAVGHAVRTLDAAGITPDLIVEGDSLAGCNWPDDLNPNTLLVATAEAAPDVTSRFENILWCVGSSMPFNQVAARLDIPLFHVSLNKTVSVHALDYLIRTGFRNIALIGQDYCFAADGRLYAEPSSKVDLSESRELPPAQGTTPVIADDSLKMLWEAFNGYLHAIRDVSGLELVNCSGGAALQHTRVRSLKEWGQSFSPRKRPSLYTVENSTFSNEVITSLCNELLRERNRVQEVLKSCGKLQQELARYPIRITHLNRKRAAIEQSIQAESTQHASLTCAPWIHIFFHIADRILKETPEMVSNEADPAQQLKFLMRRYQLVDRLCVDFLESLKGTGTPNRFSAFFEENLEAITRNNPALSQTLRELSYKEASSEFSIHWFNQVLPMVSRNGVSLSARSSFFVEARAQVDAFVQQTGFDPQRHALTVIAPGNWVYVHEFLRRFPSLELAVIDPWPVLLAQLIQCGCFLHHLPPSACVVSSWADPLYFKNRNRWRQRGLEELRFISSRVGQMSDVVVLCRNLELLP